MSKRWSGIRRFEVIEFRGGPRDGERMVFGQGHSPPQILVPMQRCSFKHLMTEEAQLADPDHVFPIGEYQPETGPYEYDTLAVSEEACYLAKARPEDLAMWTFRSKRLRPIMFKWMGER